MSSSSGYWWCDRKGCSVPSNGRVYEDRSSVAPRLAVGRPRPVLIVPLGPARGVLPRSPDVYLHVRRDVGGLLHHVRILGLRPVGLCRLFLVGSLLRRAATHSSWPPRFHHLAVA